VVVVAAAAAAVALDLVGEAEEVVVSVDVGGVVLEVEEEAIGAVQEEEVIGAVEEAEEEAEAMLVAGEDRNAISRQEDSMNLPATPKRKNPSPSPNKKSLISISPRRKKRNSNNNLFVRIMHCFKLSSTPKRIPSRAERGGSWIILRMWKKSRTRCLLAQKRRMMWLQSWLTRKTWMKKKTKISTKTRTRLIPSKSISQIQTRTSYYVG
jgi:hypothetical protein